MSMKILTAVGNVATVIQLPIGKSQDSEITKLNNIPILPRTVKETIRSLSQLLKGHWKDSSKKENSIPLPLTMSVQREH